MSAKKSNIDSIVFDAGPLITQPAVKLQQLADHCYTTPGVYRELKDERVRSELPVWSSKLQVRQPSAESVKAVSDFAKLTGDYAVLSINDVHLLALTYELECELNKGNWRLRSRPGDKRRYEIEDEKKQNLLKKSQNDKKVEKSEPVEKAVKSQSAKKPENDTKSEEVDDKKTEEDSNKESNDGWVTVHKSKYVKKSRKKAGKKHDKKKEVKSVAPPKNESNDDGEGEWITPDNIYETMLKDKQEVEETDESGLSDVKVALATGDFAIQNVAMQIGFDLMDVMSGLKIKNVRNYMYRCHACFKISPMPKDGTPLHFCPNCGGATMMRCAVSINSKTGRIIPHLKKNFQWHTRGNVYSVPSPLSKNSQKKYGKKGYQHRGNANSNVDGLYLRGDQKEYQQAIKDSKWQRNQIEKAMSEFVGGGSADNVVSPFLTSDSARPIKIHVGKGRFANAARKKRS